MSYSDAEPIFVASASEAVPLLLATYWVFNISFPKELKREYILLSIMILREKSAKVLPRDIFSYSTVQDILKKAGIKG